jgi:hypothetical protein
MANAQNLSLRSGRFYFLEFWIFINLFFNASKHH